MKHYYAKPSVRLQATTIAIALARVLCKVKPIPMHAHTFACNYVITIAMYVTTAM